MIILAHVIIAIIFVSRRKNDIEYIAKHGFQDAEAFTIYLFDTSSPRFECGIRKAWTSCYGYDELTSKWRHDSDGE